MIFNSFVFAIVLVKDKYIILLSINAYCISEGQFYF